MLLSQLPKGTLLDIWVEVMGRVNFGSTVHDRKGITEKVDCMKVSAPRVCLLYLQQGLFPASGQFHVRHAHILHCLVDIHPFSGRDAPLALNEWDDIKYLFISLLGDLSTLALSFVDGIGF